MTNSFTKIVAALALACAAPAFAAPIPYDKAGTPNTATYNLFAESTGDVVAYFAGSIASYENTISLFINGVDTGISGLNNKTSKYGDMLNFGFAKAGDRLVFKLTNLTAGADGPFYSEPTMNFGGVQHIFSSNYVGDDLIPAGVAVGFEDQSENADFDYNDENFVFSNVSVDVPEPASIALLLAGIAGLGASRRIARNRRA